MNKIVSIEDNVVVFEHNLSDKEISRLSCEIFSKGEVIELLEEFDIISNNNRNTDGWYEYWVQEKINNRNK